MKISFFLKIFLGFILPYGAWAENVSATNQAQSSWISTEDVATTSPIQSPWETQVFFENYDYFQVQDFENTILNSDNRVFLTPRALLVSELRPQFSVSRGTAFRFLLRPRWILDATEAKLANPDETRDQAKGRVELSDMYVESEVRPWLHGTLGLQVYQWGPAELLSPSNPLFHFSNQGRSSFYKEKGKLLARLNLDWNKNFNTILMLEPLSNQDPEFVAQSDFVSKFLIRNEYRSANGVDSVGFAFGREELSTSFVGQYFNWMPTEGWSLYADSKQT